MEVKLLCISMALLFLTSRAPASAQEAAADAGAEAEAGAGGDVVYYDLNRNLTLNCSLTTTDKTLTYIWRKNEESLDQVATLKNRYKVTAGGASFSLTARAVEDDFGNYSCALGERRQAWDVRGRPVVRLPDNANVVEGQRLKLQCRLAGRPYPAVTWWYRADGANASEPLAEGARGGRVRLAASEQGVAGAALLLEAAARADAGRYECRAAAPHAAADAAELRVKDMYAALWPFLGICAEVFVLCAIILVYEKRRTKPELDDSDTDNHDQKKS